MLLMMPPVIVDAADEAELMMPLTKLSLMLMTPPHSFHF